MSINQGAQFRWSQHAGCFLYGVQLCTWLIVLVYSHATVIVAYIPLLVSALSFSHLAV